VCFLYNFYTMHFDCQRKFAAVHGPKTIGTYSSKADNQIEDI